VKKKLNNKSKKIKIGKEGIFKEPLKAIKKINLDKFKVVKSFSINETFKNFKEKLKKA
jgi:hypothetical protein